MFSKPRANVIQSDTGFSVEVLGRTGMKYTQGQKSLFVDSEVLAPGKGIAIFANTITKWDPPDDSESITPDEKQIIVANIKRAMEFYGQPFEIT